MHNIEFEFEDSCGLYKLSIRLNGTRSAFCVSDNRGYLKYIECVGGRLEGGSIGVYSAIIRATLVIPLRDLLLRNTMIDITQQVPGLVKDLVDHIIVHEWSLTNASASELIIDTHDLERMRLVFEYLKRVYFQVLKNVSDHELFSDLIMDWSTEFVGRIGFISRLLDLPISEIKRINANIEVDAERKRSDALMNNTYKSKHSDTTFRGNMSKSIPVVGFSAIPLSIEVLEEIMNKLDNTY